MRLLVSWLRDFVDLDASPQEIADKMALRGFEVAAIEEVADRSSVLPPWRARDSRADAIIDFEVTANRPDALSVLGLAREIATIFDRPLTAPSDGPGALQLAPIASGDNDALRVTLEEPELCPRYAALVADVSIRPSPPWLAARLHAAGVRPISNIVDLTNYVLLELGQPMHAFDIARLAAAHIRVRRAKPGETIRTLDGVDRKLAPDMLVIADDEVAQAVAGVMGGGRSEVSEATARIALESAYFKPASVRVTSKRLGLKTEASARFERGGDVNGAVTAIRRFVALMTLVDAGRPHGAVVDRYPAPRAALSLHLRRARVAHVLGTAVPDVDIVRILSSLGMPATPKGDGFDVSVPTFRVDVSREADLIEEVGRHYGFDRLEPTFPPLTMPTPPPDPRIARDRAVRRVLTAAGSSEAVTFGFIQMRTAELFGGETIASDIVRLSNPLSATFDVLRPSLLPGLIDAVAHNRRHGRRDVRLFEIGTRFSTAAGESRALGLAWTGAAVDEHWSRTGRGVDFFDLKGIVEQVCDALHVRVHFEPALAPSFVPGRTAAIVADAVEKSPASIGIIGLVSADFVEAREAPRQDEIFAAEIDLDAAWYLRKPPQESVSALPRYPSVVRDLSILVPDVLPAAIIRGTILAAGAGTKAPLVAVAFFDRYQGKGIAEGAVSISVRLTFQAADRTLTDADVQQSFDDILQALVREHGARQR